LLAMAGLALTGGFVYLFAGAAPPIPGAAPPAGTTSPPRRNAPVDPDVFEVVPA